MLKIDFKKRYSSFYLNDYSDNEEFKISAITIFDKETKKEICSLNSFNLLKVISSNSDYNAENIEHIYIKGVNKDIRRKRKIDGKEDFFYVKGKKENYKFSIGVPQDVTLYIEKNLIDMKLLGNYKEIEENGCYDYTYQDISLSNLYVNEEKKTITGIYKQYVEKTERNDKLYKDELLKMINEMGKELSNVSVWALDKKIEYMNEMSEKINNLNNTLNKDNKIEEIKKEKKLNFTF